MRHLSPSGQHSMEIVVNGAPCRVPARPSERLSDVLRLGLGMTGTKVGCDAGDCGACTVLLDGRQVCACLVPAEQAAGRAVMTVEGLGDDPLGRRLQAAFHALGAAQCGICTPGMLIAARDLLGREPSPTRPQVLDALGGVLCRCTGYAKIVEAVEAAARGDVFAEIPGAASVGVSIPKLDGLTRLDGSALYGADAAPADALTLRVVRSPHARARFEIGGVSGLPGRFPGLALVMTARDIPGANSFGVYPDLKDQPVLADGHVRYRGEAVLALVGTREALDMVTLDDLPIRWSVEEPLIGVDAAQAPGARALHDFRPDNVLARGAVECGDPDAAFAGAPHVAEGLFETSFVEHAYIEPEAGYAERKGDRIEVFACTQATVMDRDEVARVLGVAKEQVRVIPSACGGGFGGKLDVSVQPLIAAASWILDRPVRAVWSRIESMASSTKRHPARIAAKAACDAGGRLTAFVMEGDFNTGAYASWGPTVAGRVPVHASGPYRVPNVRNRTRAIYTNETPAGAFRGFGVPQAAIAQETLFDTLAMQAGIDRLEFRLINAIRVGDATPSGQVLQASAGLAECLERLRPRWAAMLADAAAHNAALGRMRRGAGIGCMWYGIGNTSMSNPSTMRLSIDGAGALTFWNGAVDIGQGSSTVLAQIAADALGAPVGLLRQVIGDTDLTADAGKTSASRQTFVSGKAAELAGKALRAEILRLTNAGPDARIRFGGSVLTVEDGGRTATLDLAGLPREPDGSILQGVGTFDPPTKPLDARGQGVPYATYGFAAQICSLDVDLDLGTVKLNRIVAAHDLGKAINPMLVEGQIHGGIAQGIGLALMEEFIPGRTENLHDYLIPTFGDMPEIEIILVEDPEPLGPSGAKGIGEPALAPTAPAILSAIRHAVGVVPTKVPVLPHRLWELMRDRETRIAAMASSPPSWGRDREGD
jgi:CO/xanthine dehydrogenase Mo-binding subunit/aerobic-type carbon monoxide dehydrogenase small subunit (CoxS/CutS family)